MALHHRSAAAEVLARLTSEEQSRVSSPTVKSLSDEEAQANGFFNYSLSQKAQEKLELAGIYLSPFSFRPHSHPVCKTLENHILYSVLPNYVDNKFYFIGIKNFKLDFIRVRHKRLSMVESVNRYVTSLDRSRYSNELTYRSSAMDLHLSRKKGFQEIETLRDLVPPLEKKGAEFIFLHDELHYWSPSCVIKFLEAVRPTTVLASVVIPPELLAKSKESLNPWAYRYKIIKDRLIFAPDGVWTEAYDQPVRCKYLLKTKNFILSDGSIYSVDIVHSKFCHHLISITKGKLLNQDRRFFGDFDAIGLGALGRLSRNVKHCYPISMQVVTKLYLYLMTLKKPDEESAEAKLRQLVNDPTGREIKFAEGFSRLILKCKKESAMFLPSLTKDCKNFLIGLFPGFVSRMFQIYKDKCLSDFIYDLEPFNFHVDTIEIKGDFTDDFEFWDLHELRDIFSIDEELDGIKVTIANWKNSRQSQPYFINGLEWRTLGSKFHTSFQGSHNIYHLFDYCLHDVGHDMVNEELVFRKLRDLLKQVGKEGITHLISWDLDLDFLKRRLLKRDLISQDHGWRAFLRPQWFLLLRRVNTRYLCNSTSSFANFPIAECLLFKKVVDEAVKFDLRTLKRELWRPITELSPDTSLRLSSVHSDVSVNCNAHDQISAESCSIGPVVEASLESESTVVKLQPEIPCVCVGDFQIEVANSGELKFLYCDMHFPDKLKGRSAIFYAKSGIHSYTYKGGYHNNAGWPNFLSKILKIVGGDHYYNSCLAQRYEGGSSIGLHADDEKCYAVGHKVLTVNILGSCKFTICKRGEKKNKDNHIIFSLNDGDFFEMPRNFQEKCLHGVSETSPGRISLTFRRQIVDEEEEAEKVEEPKKYQLADSIVGKRFWSECATFLAEMVNVSGEGREVDLCSCFSCHNNFKFSRSIEGIRKVFSATGLAAGDHILVLNSKTQRTSLEKFKGLKVSVAVFSGNIELTEGEIPLKLGNGDLREIKAFNLSKIEVELAVLIYRGSIIQNSKLRVHKADCNFAGAHEVLFGCNLFATDELSIENFNLFHVQADGNCFWHSVGHLMNCDGLELKRGVFNKVRSSGVGDGDKRIEKQLEPNVFAENEVIAYFCGMHKRRLVVITPEHDVEWNFGNEGWPLLGFLCLMNQHFQPCAPLNGCMIRAIAEALGRREVDVLNFLCQDSTRHIFEEICQGAGLNLMYLEVVFEAFDICAKCDFGDRIETFNSSGSVVAMFDVSAEHIRCVPKISDKPHSIRIDALRSVRKSELEILGLNGTWIDYDPQVGRAEKLEQCLLAGLTGVMCSERYDNQKSWLGNIKKEMRVSRKILAIMGTFGCGKSHVYKSFMSHAAGKFVTFVSPRRQLANSIKDDLGLMKGKMGRTMRNKSQEGWSVVTFEVFLKIIPQLKRGHVVILDEIQLFPPGYLDLCLLSTDSSCVFSVAGDPCQSGYDSKGDRSILGSLDPDIFELLRNKEYSYNVESRRFKNPMFEGRLPCRFLKGSLHEKHADFVIWKSMEDLVFGGKFKIDAFLVSSFEEKRIVASHFGSAVTCLTFGESTGLNFNEGVVLITYDSIHADDKRWLTALSRFRLNIHFVNLLGMPIERAICHFAGKPLYHFLAKKSGESVILDMLPGSPKFKNGFNVSIGKDEGIKEAKLSGDPWLKVMLFLGQSEDMEIEEMEEEFKNEEWFKTHLPITSMECSRARWVGKLALRESREVRCGMETTEQFKDDHHDLKGVLMTNACERYESIYPRHKGNDSVTFLMAVKKRLRFSSAAVEEAQLRKAMPFGKFLLKKFLKHVPLRRNHNRSMMESAVADFEEKKTSKSAATIENHSGRSCKDWLNDVALIFMKSQHCTKFDNRFRDAKAGQTLACFQHAVLCRFAPYMRYIEKKVFEALPERFYIHSGKGLESLKSWVVRSDFSGICTESDYEAFDSSQDHYILSFELELMKYFGLPEDLILDYQYIKTHLGSKLGNFSIMRFTGEASTFLFNTLANMLFTFLRYDLTGSECIAFAGDDMCANRRLRVTREYEDFLKRIRLKAKVQYVESPTFCGWCLFKSGIFKRPQLVLERINIAREMNNLDNCIDNYAIEVSYAYSLGELAIGVMNDEELEAHYNCIRFLVKYKGRMKSSVKDLF
ncbi:replicase [Grapevine foveavirus A]|uniref:Replicase n=1 Tax=Grapevine foveavirus A TaxID=2763538 RepID=A0A7D5AVS7_9VIRU|nr:replicase [Grapevine foveavirus A]QKV50509.1 replicase [Grapevine foveavirus A]